MEQVETKVKRWGNSFGVILPKRVIREERLSEGVNIVITVHSKNKLTVRELVEFSEKHPLPKLKKSTDEIMREIDKELYGIER